MLALSAVTACAGGVFVPLLILHQRQVDPAGDRELVPITVEDAALLQCFLATCHSMIEVARDPLSAGLEKELR